MWEIGADSYESAIRGFWDGEITLNLSVILHFSQIEMLFFRKILLTLAGMDTFTIRKNSVQIGYPLSLFRGEIVEQLRFSFRLFSLTVCAIAKPAF